MFEFIERFLMRRRRDKAGIDRWRKDIIAALITHVIPDNVPFYYDTAFSFLQKERSKLDQPIRVDLFFPNYPLAIDIVGKDGRANYNESESFITKSDWDAKQAELSIKHRRFTEVRCPYLIIRDFEPTDLDSLKEKVKSMAGRNLNR